MHIDTYTFGGPPDITGRSDINSTFELKIQRSGLLLNCRFSMIAGTTMPVVALFSLPPSGLYFIFKEWESSQQYCLYL